MTFFSRISKALKAFHESAKNTKPLYEGFQPITERPPFPTGYRSVLTPKDDESGKR